MHVAGWIAASLSRCGLSAPLERVTGAGVWARRAATLLVVMSRRPLSAALRCRLRRLRPGAARARRDGGAACWRAAFDLFGLSASALSLDAFWSPAWYLLFLHDRVDPLAALFLPAWPPPAVAGAVTVFLRIARAREAA